jgi:hypothetical protein
MQPRADQPSTYYVMYRFQSTHPVARGEAMRDIVRRAFPPAAAQERLQRWMGTIDLESLIPQGQLFERVPLDPTAGP